MVHREEEKLLSPGSRLLMSPVGEEKVLKRGGRGVQ